MPFLPQRSVKREALFIYWLSGNGRGYSHYALTRRAGKKDVMSVSALIRLQCIPIHSLCVGGAEFNKGPWQARPSEIRSLRTFFLDMDQAPTSFLALARKRSRSPPTNKIGECIKSTSFIDGRVPTGQRFGFMHYTRLRGGSYKAYSRQGLPASKRWKRLYLLMFSPTGILPLPLKFWLAFPDLGVLTAEQYGMVRAFIMERNNDTTASLRIESCECMVGREPKMSEQQIQRFFIGGQRQNRARNLSKLSVVLANHTNDMILNTPYNNVKAALIELALLSSFLLGFMLERVLTEHLFITLFPKNYINGLVA
ncbi:hypothetical protein TanjilG_09394 [Lupinus angustifolius]|uniref:Uncharacterized protein n=1 Tax=Lupinus angustifolius TaxID=3871 RepID=A0A1J7H502_LUPAN|nr:hypothetical protein TanjilG_09394 [Lupinus angustifolius]